MSNEQYPDAVDFIVIDRATCYTVTTANMQVEEDGVDLPGTLDVIRLYAEGDLVAEYEYVRREIIHNRDHLALILQAAEVAGIDLSNWDKA